MTTPQMGDPASGGTHLPIYTAAELRDLLAQSRHLATRFVLDQRRDLLRTYRNQARTEVEDLFAATGNLANLSAATGWPILRFLPLWAISNDTLKNHASQPSHPDHPNWAGLTGPERDLVAIREQLLADDYPWLFGGEPCPNSVEVAKQKLVSAIALQRSQTAGRGNPSKNQEQQLRDMAVAAGYQPTTTRTPVDSPDDLAPGHYCPKERRIGAGGSLDKADHVLRHGAASGGRIVVLEAKFSESETNSVKRIGHECRNKVRQWQEHFGDAAVVGIFFRGAAKVDLVLKLQDLGARFIFDHETDAYSEWLQAHRQ